MKKNLLLLFCIMMPVMMWGTEQRKAIRISKQSTNTVSKPLYDIHSLEDEVAQFSGEYTRSTISLTCTQDITVNVAICTIHGITYYQTHTFVANEVEEIDCSTFSPDHYGINIQDDDNTWTGVFTLED